MSKKHDQGYQNFFLDVNRTVFGGQFDLNGRADDAEITLAAPSGNDRDITVQLKEAVGDDLVDQGKGLRGTAAAKPNVGFAQSVDLFLFADVDGLAFATGGGSTGIVSNGAGDILPWADSLDTKTWAARTDADGLLELRWTDTGSQVAFLGIRLPSGRVVISGALTI